MMKSRVVAGVLILFISSTFCGAWQLRNVVNNSDLVLQSAWYNKPKKKQINRLTAIVNSYNQKQISTIPFNYKVSEKSDGVCLIIANNNYQISFDGYPTHSVLLDRASTKSNVKKQNVGKNTIDPKKECVKKSVDPNKSPYCARAFIEFVSNNQTQIINCVAQGYSQDNAVFDIILAGSQGNYSIQLQ